MLCEYVYCRAPWGGAEDVCASCGFPRDARLVRDPAFLLAAADAVDGLPRRLLDMHQILPAFDGVLEMQLLAMRRFGIAKALLQSAPRQASALWGNEKILELAQRSGETFWASQFVDPRQPDALAELERFAAANVKVVKLIPSAGYAADDPGFTAFWQAMDELRMVAMVHTGFITARHKEEEARAGMFLSSRYADPLYLDHVCRRCPRVTFIVCHMGGSLWYEAAARMVTEHDNVWGDVSASGVFALRRLLRLGTEVDWSKIFWGNDSPPFAYPFNLRLHLRALRDAGSPAALARDLLHDNAQRFAERVLA